jgi:phage tail sheath gpL-like
MPISFNQIPADSLVPFFYIEFDNSIADQGSQVVPWAVLLIGQKTSAGSATPKEIVEIVSDGQGEEFFGTGAMLARQVEAYRSKLGRMRLFCLPLEDSATGVAAVKTISYAGAATAAGEEAVYVGGRKASVGVQATDTAEDVVDDLVIAINAIPNVAMIASSTVAGELILTARNKGAQGQQIDVRTDYNGEKGAPGITGRTIADTTVGTVDPDMTAEGVVGIMGDDWFQAIGQPYQDNTNMDLIDTELESRWGPGRQIGGIQYTAKDDTFVNVQTWGDGKNSPFTCALDAGDMPTPPEEYAAEICAEVANAANIDPARPFQTLALAHTLPPVKADRRTNGPGSENDVLLKSGVATYTVDNGGTVRIQRVVTTYKTNANGATDKSYRQANTVYTLQAIRYDFRVYMLNKYPRHKLASDGANFGAGQAIITPKVGKAEAVARAIVWEDLGWIEDIDAFKKALICERNSGDTERLDWYLEPNLVNGFRIAGVQVAFIL